MHSVVSTNVPCVIGLRLGAPRGAARPMRLFVRLRWISSQKNERGFNHRVTSIDLVQAKMEFQEKDPKYRVPIVAALDGG
jgi:hypothetical protein